MSYTVDWAEIRSRAFATLWQVAAATVVWLAVAIPVTGEVTFTFQGLWTVAVASVLAGVRNFFLEKKTVEGLNAINDR
jgi:hypothetical protein